MDTGGMFASASGGEKVIARATNLQAKFAIDTADTVVFVVDSQEGLTPLDEEIAALLRSAGKDVILAVNKVDVPSHAARSSEFFSLGFADTAEVSAEHGYGMEALMEMLEARFGKIEPAPDGGEGRIKISVAAGRTSARAPSQTGCLARSA